MFTGLIEELGEVLSAARPGRTQRLVISSRTLSTQLRSGDSIAVSGVCLTAVVIAPGKSFTADLAQETVERTSLAALVKGSTVNLELPTPAGRPLGGHIVQGHVDGVGKLISLRSLGQDWRMELSVPAKLTKYIVNQGSIAIEGISLTVARIQANRVTIAVIPHSYSATNLHTLKVGSAVNIETDILAKYAEKMQDSRASNHEPSGPLTIEKLMAAGF